MKNIYIQLLDELRKNTPLALATIIGKKGSAPQIPGASAIFSSGGLCTGTVGGGLLEADAQTKALRCLQQGISLLYTFGLTSDISSAEGAICGGEATILMDACPEDHTEIFESISKSLNERHPGVLATFIGRHSNSLFGKENTDDKVSLARYWVEMGEDLAVDPQMPYAEFHEEIKRSLIENKPNLLKVKDSTIFENAGETLLFLEPVYPLPHLIIAGAGHIGQALSHLGSLLDFEVTVIDDRPEFANKERLPDAGNIIVDEIEKAMKI